MVGTKLAFLSSSSMCFFSEIQNLGAFLISHHHPWIYLELITALDSTLAPIRCCGLMTWKELGRGLWGGGGEWDWEKRRIVMVRWWWGCLYVSSHEGRRLLWGRRWAESEFDSFWLSTLGLIKQIWSWGLMGWEMNFWAWVVYNLMVGLV